MFTKNYIRMCEKAEEIQKAWRVSIGDLCKCKKDSETYIISKFKSDGIYKMYEINEINYSSVTGFIIENEFKDDFTYLPAQEQLWDMLPEIKDKVHVVFRFNKFLSNKYINDSAHVAFLVLSNMPKEDEEDFSISELLFCFAMKELYNKIWTGKDWINGISTDK